MKTRIVFFLGAMLLASTFARADITDCGRSTSRSIISAGAAVVISHDVPQGSCDSIGLIGGGVVNNLDCRNKAQTAGYACFQVGTRYYQGRGGSYSFPECFGCL